jgi:hypothetical protein
MTPGDEAPGSLPAEAARTAFRLAALALRPWEGLLTAGLGVERAVRRAFWNGAGDALLDVLETTLASPVAEQASVRILASPLVERAASQALRGPLVEAVAGDLAQYAVLERAARELFAGDRLERMLAGVDDAEVPQRVAEQLLAAGIAEDIASRILNGPEIERIVVAMLESPGFERLADRVLGSASAERIVARVIESRLVDEAVARLLESDDLWVLVDEIARSPAVTEAIGQQGLGFADQVAGAVRGKSRKADARLERTVRRLLRRHQDGAPPPGPAGQA